jgi:hypothetical protein
MNRTCESCGSVFYRKLSDIKNYGGKFCSRKCHYLARKTSVTLTCPNCSVGFSVIPYRIKVAKNVFCSTKCSGDYKREDRKEIACKQCGCIFYKLSSSMADNRGKFCTAKCFREYNRGERHKQWLGDRIGYRGLHKWVRRHLGVPNNCAKCLTTDDIKYEWANKSHEYKRDLGDWFSLCISCHRKYDNAKDNLSKNQ